MADELNTADGGKDKHRDKVLSVRPPAGMRGVIAQMAEKERRKMAQMILVLLEEALEARGVWPPPPPKEKRR